ncbi:DUF7432 family protein [Amycolatopsis japonica]
MSEQKKRPESFEDLTGYETDPVTLASIELDMNVIGRGLLAAADQLVAAFRGVYGEALIVTVEHSRVRAARPHTDEEKAEVLARHQKNWDEEAKHRREAEVRKKLKVGDLIDVENTHLTCRRMYKADCDLHYEHQGDHIEVVDGRVSKKTRR